MREKDEREGVGESSKANRHGYIHRLDKTATSYFFTNFPDEVKAVDLWPRFARFGRVGEVFIPAKVDKQGKRFGFVKFREVKDATELLRSISNIWIDSFKLRINLSKFNRKSEAARREERKETIGSKEGSKTGRNTDGRSFKAALLAVEAEGQRRNVVGKVVPKGIWEVEVEEERLMRLEGACVGFLTEEKDPQAIQYDFNMNGFQNLKVCSLGHLQILLWSEKTGEVEEVMGTVGWWCSLFEKLVPWSPELVTNSRVTWLRCHGVPPHAWGNNIFRSIAFKYGRFIGVDDSTKEMRRCDVARIKIITNDKAAIDSTMAVKVLGKRFDIRILEEVGEVLAFDRIGGNDGVAWPEDHSSRASGDGASFQAVVEGGSETGSDADVSESCQVLLGLEAQGTRRTVTGDSLRALEDKECDSAGNTPNKLGNPVDLVATVVNSDSDKRDDVFDESAGKVLRLEGVMTGVVGGVQEDEVDASVLGGSVEGLAGLVEEGELGDPVISGPVHQVFGCSEVDCSDGGGCEEIIGKRIGPKFLRTKKGDLCVEGPVKQGEAHWGTTTKKPEKNSSRPSRPTSRKNNQGLKVIPDLPPKKMRYFSAPPYPRNHPSRKKKPGNRNTPKEIPCESDSIHNSDIPTMGTQSSNNDDFVLEVVLPYAPPRVERGQQAIALQEETGTMGMLNRGSNAVGTMSMTNPGSNADISVNYRTGDIVLEAPSRQVMEATKILSIQNQVGITVQSSKEDHLKRIELMEVRDRAEKEGWELNRVTEGFQ
jgi:RNA recognition motif-containing protein